MPIILPAMSQLINVRVMYTAIVHASIQMCIKLHSVLPLLAQPHMCIELSIWLLLLKQWSQQQILSAMCITVHELH